VKGNSVGRRGLPVTMLGSAPVATEVPEDVGVTAEGVPGDTFPEVMT